ncbi:hypothetical protein TNCV_3936131 [Trichonephila clavipes]|nr:hypothetical protein TNCV_3936131 [Trichonephila clavipes]
MLRITRKKRIMEDPVGLNAIVHGKTALDKTYFLRWSGAVYTDVKPLQEYPTKGQTLETLSYICRRERRSPLVFNPPTGQHGFFRPTREASKTDQTEFSPDGHGYELVSSVRALVPQKFSVEEELMHVKHVEVKSPPVGVMWKFGRGVISSGIVLVT